MSTFEKFDNSELSFSRETDSVKTTYPLFKKLEQNNFTLYSVCEDISLERIFELGIFETIAISAKAGTYQITDFDKFYVPEDGFYLFDIDDRYNTVLNVTQIHTIESKYIEDKPEVKSALKNNGFGYKTSEKDINFN